jgi:chemotaxis protein methyltransferase CheR
MRDEDCVGFLQWCLPRLGLRWRGYRKVRRTVCKRLQRRLAEVGVADLAAYRAFLATDPGEWSRVDEICRIPISRFYRDRNVFEAVAHDVLPALAAMVAARGGSAVRCWSVGCAAGEEPYSLALAWRFRVAADWPGLRLTILATDADEAAIGRARTACYRRSSIEELPPDWREHAFVPAGSLFRLSGEVTGAVELRVEDIREAMPDGPFELILCRNLVFTYFDDALQRRLLGQIGRRLAGGGFLVLGKHEALPADAESFAAIAPGVPIYRKRAAAAGC